MLGKDCQRKLYDELLRQLVARLALAAVEGLASSTLFVEHMTHESFDFVGGTSAGDDELHWLQ